MGRVVADSNVILRYLEGHRNIGAIFVEHEVYYNDIIFSEVLYSAIRYKTGKRPYDIKKNPEVIADAKDTMLMVNEFFRKYLTFLPVTQEITERAVKYSIKYKLLPNDALILATAEEYGIEYVVTYDEDLLRLKNTSVKITTPEDLLQKGSGL